MQRPPPPPTTFSCTTCSSSSLSSSSVCALRFPFPSPRMFEHGGLFPVQPGHAHLQSHLRRRFLVFDQRWIGNLFASRVNVPIAIWNSGIADYIRLGIVEMAEVVIQHGDFLAETAVRGMLDRLDGQEKLRGSTCFEYDFERVHEEARLGEHVGVELGVGKLGHNGAASWFENGVELRTSQGSKALSVRVLEDRWLAECNLEAFLESFKSNWRWRRRIWVIDECMRHSHGVRSELLNATVRSNVFNAVAKGSFQKKKGLDENQVDEIECDFSKRTISVVSKRVEQRRRIYSGSKQEEWD
ncbi:S-adenosylmethionine decarboxylase proenzyme [Senna tora]|uniref:S-adenosylmethionine decarboxylase proenzyme n=1 Tax=Senna tora TaxID=362788 RepID=A0A835CCM9_9FABA|nr:S-adenosylmethionine decarboxylase proenzyme [Senna tora]